MAPNSNERRDVAERLREYSHDVLKDGSLLKTLKDMTGACSWRDVLDRLADLIDPTCHVIPGKEAVAELKDGTRLTGVPLSCGHVVFGVSAKDMPKFCCECGSRITSGGER